MYHFIVNPNARSGLGRQVWKKVEERLKEEHTAYQVYFTKFQRHATQLAARITSDGEPHTLVILGGDGTINEVVNGICSLEKTTVGYIPVGSGNDFARGLGIPSDLTKALDTILTSSGRKKIDLGVLMYPVLMYPEKRLRFAVSSGIGYDAAICRQVGVSRVKPVLNRLRLGKLSYVCFALDQLFRCRPGKMTVTLEHGRTMHYERTYFAAAMNLPFEGGGCKFCPDARPDDKALDLIVIANVPKTYALLILPTVFFGKHTRLPGVHIFRCRKAQIESEAALPLHVDGEPLFRQSLVEFSIEKDPLSFII